MIKGPCSLCLPIYEFNHRTYKPNKYTTTNIQTVYVVFHYFLKPQKSFDFKTKYNLWLTKSINNNKKYYHSLIYTTSRSYMK